MIRRYISLITACALLPLGLWAQLYNETDTVETTEISDKGDASKSYSVEHVRYLNHVAYGLQDVWKTSSAMSTTGGEQLMRITSPTVGNALKGLLPGLTVMQQADEPGYDFYMQNMYTRGVSSFVGGQKMLVFIDGFEAPLDYISAEEIESVSLLKDAAALALYGAWCQWRITCNHKERQNSIAHNKIQGANRLTNAHYKPSAVGELRLCAALQPSFGQRWLTSPLQRRSSGSLSKW